MAYLLPATRGIDSRRHCILESLERSHYESGSLKQHSGYGMDLGSRKGPRDEYAYSHITSIYRSIDEKFSDALTGASVDSFPIKRLYNICSTYSSVWNPKKLKQGDRSKISAKLHVSESAESRGAFPYVDERATVLPELTKSAILQTRHRVNSDSHPKWALRTLRRRRRKQLLRLKKRSISQEATRELQARLLADKGNGSHSTAGR